MDLFKAPKYLVVVAAVVQAEGIQTQAQVRHSKFHIPQALLMRVRSSDVFKQCQNWKKGNKEEIQQLLL